MKNLQLLSLAVLFSTASIATTITVDNKTSNSGAQYTSLQAAITAATAGDTILVAGSPTSYGTVSMNKELHIVGVGYKPFNLYTAYITQLSTISLNSGSSNSSIKGIKGGVNLNGVSNIEISRCETTINFFGSASNVLIYNNIIEVIGKGYQTNGVSDIIISNNIIKTGIGLAAIPPNYITSNIIITNNLFVKNGGFALVTGNYDTYNSTFTNNVFYGSSIYYETVNVLRISNSNFSNNLSFNTPNNNFPVTGTNSGGNNLIGQDPLFTSSTNLVFDYTDDFNYPANSPLVNAGSDGSDIGIYGGSYPWPEGGFSGSGYMYSQEPQYPQVNQMNVNTISVPQNGTLNVTVKGIKND